MCAETARSSSPSWSRTARGASLPCPQVSAALPPGVAAGSTVTGDDGASDVAAEHRAPMVAAPRVRAADAAAMLGQPAPQVGAGARGQRVGSYPRHARCDAAFPKFARLEEQIDAAGWPPGLPGGGRQPPSTSYLRFARPRSARRAASRPRRPPPVICQQRCTALSPSSPRPSTCSLMASQLSPSSSPSRDADPLLGSMLQCDGACPAARGGETSLLWGACLDAEPQRWRWVWLGWCSVAERGERPAWPRCSSRSRGQFLESGVLPGELVPVRSVGSPLRHVDRAAVHVLQPVAEDRAVDLLEDLTVDLDLQVWVDPEE